MTASYSFELWIYAEVSRKKTDLDLKLWGEENRGKKTCLRLTEMQHSQPRVTQKRRGKRLVGLTLLQSRSEVERERFIGDKVARVLEEGMGNNHELFGSLNKSIGGGKSTKNGESSSHYWSLPTKLNTVTTEQLVSDKFQNYLHQRDSCAPAPPCPSPPTNMFPGIRCTSSYAYLQQEESISAILSRAICR